MEFDDEFLLRRVPNWDFDVGTSSRIFELANLGVTLEKAPPPAHPYQKLV